MGYPGRAYRVPTLAAKTNTRRGWGVRSSLKNNRRSFDCVWRVSRQTSLRMTAVFMLRTLNSGHQDGVPGEGIQGSHSSRKNKYAARVGGKKFAQEQPQILRLRLARLAPNFAQDDSSIYAADFKFRTPGWGTRGGHAGF